MNAIIHYLMKIVPQKCLIMTSPTSAFGFKKNHFPAALTAFLENRQYSDSKAAHSLVTTNIK